MKILSPKVDVIFNFASSKLNRAWAFRLKGENFARAINSAGGFNKPFSGRLQLSAESSKRKPAALEAGDLKGLLK